MKNEEYKIGDQHAVVRNGRIVLVCDEEEACAFGAWLRHLEQMRQRDDATAVAIGLGIEGVGGDA